MLFDGIGRRVAKNRNAGFQSRRSNWRGAGRVSMLLVRSVAFLQAREPAGFSCVLQGRDGGAAGDFYRRFCRISEPDVFWL
jgi:hypothetical protein